MEHKAISALMIMGLAFLLMGGIMLLWTALHPPVFRTADAVIERSIFSDATGKLELIVRFAADGEVVRKHTQPIREGRVQGTVGSHVSVAYSRSRVLGLEAWRVYVNADAAEAARRVRRLRMLCAGAAILAGIGLLAVAAGIDGMRK